MLTAGGLGSGLQPELICPRQKVQFPLGRQGWGCRPSDARPQLHSSVLRPAGSKRHGWGFQGHGEG